LSEITWIGYDIDLVETDKYGFVRCCWQVLDYISADSTGTAGKMPGYRWHNRGKSVILQMVKIVASRSIFANKKIHHNAFVAGDMPQILLAEFTKTLSQLGRETPLPFPTLIDVFSIPISRVFGASSLGIVTRFPVIIIKVGAYAGLAK